MLTVKKAAQIIEVREKIQEEIRTQMKIMPYAPSKVDDICQIVVDAFKEFEIDAETGMHLYSTKKIEEAYEKEQKELPRPQ